MIIWPIKLNWWAQNWNRFLFNSSTFEYDFSSELEVFPIAVRISVWLWVIDWQSLLLVSSTSVKFDVNLMCQYQLGISFSLPLSLSIDFSQYLRLQSFWLAELLFTRWKPTNILVWFWWIVAFNLRKSAAVATITIPTKTVRRDDENTLKKKNHPMKVNLNQCEKLNVN